MKVDTAESPLVTTAWLAAHLSDPGMRIVDVRWRSRYEMLAPPDQFARVMSRLGIGDDTLVVVYDNMGFPLGSARVWWALRHYGHDRVRVLDGGLRAWQSEGRLLSTDVTSPGTAEFTPACARTGRRRSKTLSQPSANPEQ